MSRLATEPARWPSAVLDAPVLRGLDARAIREIEAAGRLRSLRDGDTVYEPGDGGEAFFVVASGVVELRAVRRGDAVAGALRTARPGDSFGEEPLVGASRRAGATAAGATVVAEIPVPLFRRAIGRSGRAEVAERLERTLRRTLVRDVLRASAIGGAVDGEALDALVDGAIAEQASRGQTIYEEGERARQVYIVGEGLVQLQSSDGERVRIRGYASAGDLVGHDALDSGARGRPTRSATAIAMGPTLLVALPVDAIDGVTRLGGAPRDLGAELRRISRAEDDARGAVVARAADNATMHVFRDLHRLEVARSLLVIDLETCVRCGHCAWACGSLYGTSRLVRRGDVIVTDPGADSPRSGARDAERTWVSGEDPPAASRARAGDDVAFDVFAPGALGAEEDRPAPQKLLLPSSCQHCENPACLIDCPTGAIGKDPTGEVFIREPLCTGCGACVRACPWDNVRLADRPAGTAKPRGVAAELVAVKCDLCRTWENGPACVQACPVEAISRIRPTDDIAELRAMVAIGNDDHAGPRALGRAADPTTAHDKSLRRVWAATPSWAVVLGAALATGGAALSVGGLVARGAWVPRSGMGYASGVVAALALVLLGLYGVPKRVVRLWMGRRRREDRDGAVETTPEVAAPKRDRKVRSFVRPHYVAHLALGLVALVAAVGHAPIRGGATVASALLYALGASGIVGIAAALAYAFLPRRLARLERAALLPEDFDAAEAQLVDRLHRELSGTSELVKAIAGKVLVPYAKHPLGPLLLFLSGHHLRDEERRLSGEVEALLEGRGRDRLGGLSRLVRTAVEMRALPAQRWVTRLLRSFLPIHAVLGATALALLIFHVAAVLLR